MKASEQPEGGHRGDGLGARSRIQTWDGAHFPLGKGCQTDRPGHRRRANLQIWIWQHPASHFGSRRVPCMCMPFLPSMDVTWEQDSGLNKYRASTGLVVQK